MSASRFLHHFAFQAFVLVTCLTATLAHSATPLPVMADTQLQNCLQQQASANGWQYAEQVVQLNCAQRGVVHLAGIEMLINLTELDVSANALMDAWPLSQLRSLTKLNLSGNRALQLTQLRPIIDQNWNLTRLGLNGIKIGSFSNLGPLQAGRPTT